MSVEPDNQPPQPFLSDEERVRLLEANVTDYAIFMVGTDERIASWNAGAERILGYEEGEIIGQSASIIFTPEDRQRGEDTEEFRIARETGRAEDERWHVRKDGSWLWGNGILTALFDDNRELRGYAKILRDFTERKHHEQQIEALNARLQWALTETHHRVKNNLQILCAMIDFQIMGRVEPVSVDEYRRLGNQIRALAAVHDNLTEDTKAGADATAISITSMLETLLPLLQTTAGTARLQHQFEAQETARLSARKGSSLALIVNELVANALKHGNGNVWIAFSALEGNASLSVCDDGAGFPEGFETRRSSSTGLELVETLAQLDLRGAVRYTNRPEGGGCVTVVFSTD